MYNVFNSEALNSKPLPVGSCLVNFSMFRELDSPIHFRSFSIKYVASGNETYFINGTKYEVKQGEYVLANQFAEGKVEIESKNAVKGICIDVAPHILSEVTASYLRPDTPDSDLSLDVFFNSKDFFDNKYQASQTHVGQFLFPLDHIITSNPFEDHHFQKEFYYNLAEGIIKDQWPILNQLKSIHSIKYETKKDLLRRVHLGKVFIENHYQMPINIENVVKEVHMSEFHFFRTFKMVYGISPYQYLINQRLSCAKSMLEKKSMPISEIAILCGFSDIYHFSKAFKKMYGMAPSKV